MNPTKYVKEAVWNCAVHLLFNYWGKYGLPKKAQNPFKLGFDPELDTSPEFVLFSSYYHHPRMDDQDEKNWNNNEGVIIVISCSTP